MRQPLGAPGVNFFVRPRDSGDPAHRHSLRQEALDSRLRGNERSCRDTSEHQSSLVCCEHAPSFGELSAPRRRQSEPAQKVRGGEAPNGAGADRRTRGPPCGRTGPFKDRRSITRTGAPFGASPRRLLVPRHRASGAGRGAGLALIPEALASVRPALVQPLRADPPSGVGRWTRGLPGAWLTRPNPRAPLPLRQLASPVDALG
jgi:hypothetical protein